MRSDGTLSADALGPVMALAILVGVALSIVLTDPLVLRRGLRGDMVSVVVSHLEALDFVALG